MSMPQSRSEIQARYYAKHRGEIRAKAKKKYDEDPEKARADSRRWRTNNPERRKEITRRYREANREKLRAAGREYARRRYAEDPDRGRRLAREWYAANLDRGRIGKRESQARYKARKVGAFVSEVTAEDIARMLVDQQERCNDPGCGVSLPGGYHVDHVIPLSKGGTHELGNVQLLCPHCNISKRDKMPEEFASRRGRLF